MKQCPSCQFLVPSDTESCNFCGHDFEVARAEAELAATRALAEEAAQRVREQAQAKGIGHFSAERPVRVGEEHLEAPVSRMVVASCALMGLLLLAGVGWWMTRSSSDSSPVASSASPTVAIYVPPTTTVVAYSPLTTPVDPNEVKLGPISVVMPGVITTSPAPGAPLGAAPLIAESRISVGHFARVTIRSVDVSKPDAIGALLSEYATTSRAVLARSTPTSALGGLPAVEFELGTARKHHGLEVMGPGFVLVLDVWHAAGTANGEDAAAYASLVASLAASPG